MGVYIPGMEMPTSCMLCPFCVEEADPANGEMCMVTWTLMPPCTRERLDNCPLVPVPKHGDLIDRQAFRYEMDKHYPFDNATQRRHGIEDVLKSAVLRMLFDAPTIIPADKEVEG